VSFGALTPGDLSWEERPSGNGVSRFTADLTTAFGLEQSRARLWRLQPGARGRRHIELVQEEVWVVLEGSLTLLLGEPPERLELGPGGVASAKPGTAIQLRNDGDTDALVFAYGAPPVAGQAELLDDVELA